MSGDQVASRGGSVGPYLCAKHMVPTTRTITGNYLCAVCECDRADAAVAMVETLKIEKASLVEYCAIIK